VSAPLATPSAARRPAYSRAALPPEPPRPLLVLTGAARRRHLLIYAAIHAVLFGGLLYGLVTAPALVLFGLALCYALENLMFVFGHIALHVTFIEFPEQSMMTLGHHSFVHHYRDIRAYHRSWLATRLSYFYCPQLGLRSMSTKGYLVAQLVAATIIAAFDLRAGVCALACMWAMRSLQSICHEYYHNDDREGFYWPPTRLLLAALEALGVLSTRRHLRHHRHHLRNLDAVHDWTDMWLPGAERLGGLVWRRMLARHVPGEQRMIAAIRRLFTGYAALHYAVVIVGFLAAAAVLG
jgi:hypothetical protein